MGGFRRFIIGTAEVLMIILVAIMTLGFAISFGGSMSMMGGGLGVVGFLLGGAIGFIVASIFAAYFFLLSEIAENTRRIR